MAKISKIALIIGGGVAAYKALELIRLFRSENIEITPIMTKASQEFITPLSVSVLSGNKAFLDLFDYEEEVEIGHIELSRKADLVLLAPATANLIAKMACGIADDLATNVLLATNKKILLAPAMNVKMWEHPATVRNIKLLKQDGINFVGPEKGDMACGEFGFGRMSEPVDILKIVKSFSARGPLKGKRILVTSGPTHEPIDPVRYIANRSSGYQGKVIADSLVKLGAEVYFVTGPVSTPMPIGAHIFNVETAAEMLNIVLKKEPFHAAICVAAVADWRTEFYQSKKLKKEKKAEKFQLSLVKNPDILKSLSTSEKRPKLIVGFAAETENLEENAIQKLKEKSCDWILANDVGPEEGSMGRDTTKITMITSDGVINYEKMLKTDFAKILGEKIVKVLA